MKIVLKFLLWPLSTHSVLSGFTMVAEDLDWSIRPLFLWMNLLGIDFSLDIPGWRYCGKIWTTFCFLFCAVSHILQFEQFWRTRHDYAATYGDSRTTVSLTHVVISYAKTGVQWLGYHLLLLFVCTYTWIEVRRSFKTIERRLIISQDDRRLTRRLSIAGIVYICVLVSNSFGNDRLYYKEKYYQIFMDV